ncbi:hypothetical protein HAX54_032537 [Datura stramonium]|uniref:Uncharacterized protein n=1 Tax=Datura stramonium TaxID=4076 RepID=A0ABS8VDT4_DATST|nr:hypothetical protein [Datura stramonium]
MIEEAIVSINFCISFAGEVEQVTDHRKPYSPSSPLLGLNRIAQYFSLSDGRGDGPSQDLRSVIYTIKLKQKPHTGTSPGAAWTSLGASRGAKQQQFWCYRACDATTIPAQGQARGSPPSARWQAHSNLGRDIMFRRRGKAC